MSKRITRSRKYPGVYSAVVNVSLQGPDYSLCSALTPPQQLSTSTVEGHRHTLEERSEVVERHRGALVEWSGSLVLLWCVQQESGC